MQNRDFKFSAIYNMAPAVDQKAFDDAKHDLDERKAQFAEMAQRERIKLMPLRMKWKIMCLKRLIKQSPLDRLFDMDPRAGGAPFSATILRQATHTMKCQTRDLLSVNVALAIAQSSAEVLDMLKHPRRHTEKDSFNRLLDQPMRPCLLSVEQLNAAQAALTKLAR